MRSAIGMDKLNKSALGNLGADKIAGGAGRAADKSKAMMKSLGSGGLKGIKGMGKFAKKLKVKGKKKDGEAGEAEEVVETEVSEGDEFADE